MATEKASTQQSGWTMLFFNILFTFVIIGIIIFAAVNDIPLLMIPVAIFFILNIIIFVGFFTIEPNEAMVLLLFGRYVGTEKTTGFKWCNPFYSKKKISLRARNFDGQKLKVNDKKGNPIEISAVVVWRVKDTAQALFDVENYVEYVQVQAESALRHMATSFAYDDTDGEEVTLRASQEEVSEALKKEIQERVLAAGVNVDEAKINHLAYAPEIAHAMLQRQQAEAIIAARTKIVEGAVSMVQMALDKLKDQNIVDLDEDKKATMVSNLLVVLCSDKSTQPIVNTGSIY
jgi:regulator of protease activity HflC (stomatin/prohibitin superfamily)